MESRTPKNIRKLVDRYLDPTRSWDPKRDSSMRALLRESEVGRRYYNQAIITHRLMVSGDAETPTGFEDKRLFMAVSGVELPERSADGAFWARFGGIALLGAALIVFAVNPPKELVSQGPVGSDYIGSRGVVQNAAMVGLGIEGLDAKGRSYEIDTGQVAAEGVKQDDAIRLSYTNDTDTLRYLFVFAVQTGNDFVWYAPDPTEGKSIAIERGKHVGLFEVDAMSPHRTGKVRIIALFTERPVSLKTVASLGQEFFLEPNIGRMIKRTNEALGLDSKTEIVSVRESFIQPRSKGDNAP